MPASLHKYDRRYRANNSKQYNQYYYYGNHLFWLVPTALPYRVARYWAFSSLNNLLCMNGSPCVSSTTFLAFSIHSCSIANSSAGCMAAVLAGCDPAVACREDAPAGSSCPCDVGVWL